MFCCWILLNIICDKWKFQTFNQLTRLEYITCCSNSIWFTPRQDQAPSSIFWEQTTLNIQRGKIFIQIFYL
jgi:hypothetical protein